MLNNFNFHYLLNIANRMYYDSQKKLKEKGRFFWNLP